MNVHYNIGSGPSSGNKLTRDTIKSFLEFKAENEANAVNDAPIGILGFAVIMAVISALITDERLKQLNSFINGI
ncbi:TPA: hypothetical protein HNO33_20015 [Escherichia coli]|nr:hypothetical protein [Escherichia coli]